jgi:hypothetical protein
MTKEDLKYPSPPPTPKEEEEERDEPPMSETPLTKYIKCGPTNIDVTLSNKKQLKLRKLAKWQRFRNFQKQYETLDKQAAQHASYPAAPSIATVNMDPKVSPKESRSSNKKRKPMDPPRIITTPRSQPQSESQCPEYPPCTSIVSLKQQNIKQQHPRGFHPIQEGSFQQPINISHTLDDGASQNPIFVEEASQEIETPRRYPTKLPTFWISKTPTVKFDFTPSKKIDTRGKEKFKELVSTSIQQQTPTNKSRSSFLTPRSPYRTPSPSTIPSPSRIPSKPISFISTPPPPIPEQPLPYRTTIRPRCTPPHWEQHTQYLQRNQSSLSASSSSANTSNKHRRDRIQESRDEQDGLIQQNILQQQSHSPFLSSPISSKSYPSNKGMDQKSIRLMFARDFISLIQTHKRQRIRHIPASPILENGVVTYTIQTRPLLLSTTETVNSSAVSDDFSVLESHGDHNAVVLYETSMDTHQHTHVTPHFFSSHSILSKATSTQDVYQKVGLPLVTAAQQGLTSCLIVCGSKGSGKTHSTMDVQECLASTFSEPLEVNYVEVQNGKHIVDLLSPGSFVTLDEGGSLQNAKTAPANTPQELVKLFISARRRLKSRASVRSRSSSLNSMSSFLVCQLRYQYTRGCFTLLECPSQPTPELERLLSHIQAKQLYTASRIHRQRQDLLTNLLQLQQAQNIGLLLTTSPNATDTEETLAMLKLLQSSMELSSSLHSNNNNYTPIKASGNDCGALLRRQSTSTPTGTEPRELILPRQWTHEELMAWINRKHLVSRYKEPPIRMNGRMAMRLTKQQLYKTFYCEQRDSFELASKLYQCLRTENDRIARLRVKKRMTFALG